MADDVKLPEMTENQKTVYEIIFKESGQKVTLRILEKIEEAGLVFARPEDLGRKLEEGPAKRYRKVDYPVTAMQVPERDRYTTEREFELATHEVANWIASHGGSFFELRPGFMRVATEMGNVPSFQGDWIILNHLSQFDILENHDFMKDYQEDN